MSLILILVNTTSIGEVVSQLNSVCLPHLSTLFIITDDDSIPKPSVFAPLFQYNCFPCLKQISILRLKEPSIEMEKVEEKTCTSYIGDETECITDEEFHGMNESEAVNPLCSSGIMNSWC